MNIAFATGQGLKRKVLISRGLLKCAKGLNRILEKPALSPAKRREIDMITCIVLLSGICGANCQQ